MTERATELQVAPQKRYRVWARFDIHQASLKDAETAAHSQFGTLIHKIETSWRLTPNDERRCMWHVWRAIYAPNQV